MLFFEVIVSALSDVRDSSYGTTIAFWIALCQTLPGRERLHHQAATPTQRVPELLERTLQECNSFREHDFYEVQRKSGKRTGWLRPTAPRTIVASVRSNQPQQTLDL